MPKKRNSSKASKIKKPSQKAVKKEHSISNYKHLKKYFSSLFAHKALFVFGALFLADFTILEPQSNNTTRILHPSRSSSQKIFPIPTQLIIKKIGIDLPIEETAINNGVWQIGEKGASHLTISARPGEKGPIILYGHNTVDRLGPIRWLSKGTL